MASAEIFYGSTSETLATEVAHRLNLRCSKFMIKNFPDGESYVRVDKDGGLGDCILVSSLYPNQNTRIIETMLMLEALRENGASRITLVIPYLAYARQDRVFLNGEAVSVKALGAALMCSGADEIYAVEAHSREALTALSAKAYNIEIKNSIKEAITNLAPSTGVIAAPDERAADRAKNIADALGFELVRFKKERDRIDGSIKTTVVDAPRIDGKEVMLVDDIVSTGGSMALASQILKKLGARCVRAVCVHALMVNGAEQRLRESGVIDVFGSNTIESEFSRYSVSYEVSQEV